jgi:hypothetical protein
VRRLRTTVEWSYVIREVDIRLRRKLGSTRLIATQNQGQGIRPPFSEDARSPCVRVRILRPAEHRHAGCRQEDD